MWPFRRFSHIFCCITPVTNWIYLLLCTQLLYSLPLIISDIFISSSVLWCCWFGGKKVIWPVKNWVMGAGMVICLGEVPICIWPSWCHWHSLSLAPVNPDWFYLSDTDSPGLYLTQSMGLQNGSSCSIHIGMQWYKLPKFIPSNSNPGLHTASASPFTLNMSPK